MQRDRVTAVCCVANFLFVIIEFFRYLLRLRCYKKRRSVEVGVFQRGWVTLSLNFRLKGYFSRHYTIYAYLLNHLSVYFSDYTCRHDQISH